MTTAGDVALSALIGESVVMREMRDLIQAVARTPLPVLVLGPTGSGKELVARAIHAASASQGSLVCFNAAALTDSMFEDTLFGHVRGAFTGAVSDHTGLLAEADGGTLFADEVASMSIVAQAKMLRAIETGEYRAVGAQRDKRSRFRLVSAANDDMRLLVTEKRFRSDLLHRLAGVVIEVPSLAERRGDIPALARHYLTLESGRDLTLDDDAAALLAQRHWPGNVRELRHLMALVAALSDTRVTMVALRRALSLRLESEIVLAIEMPERRELSDALERHGWDTESAADELGIHRTTLYRRMKRYRLTPPALASHMYDAATQ
ncbi:MAG: Response regulator of zinc sigma-54-dependent two-component system [Gemmatimonadetes bacterium]|nr:Response regulator of zinc sigma-54-dependent two-component system [Gemmatimonadota bacterium]